MAGALRTGPGPLHAVVPAPRSGPRASSTPMAVVRQTGPAACPMGGPRIIVAGQLVVSQTVNTAGRRIRVSNAPRQDWCSNRWYESCETANTNTRLKNRSSGYCPVRS